MALSKLRRLQIQEMLLFKSIQQSVPNTSETNTVAEEDLSRVQSAKLKKEYITLKNLFDGISKQVSTKEWDAINLKNDINNLEINLRNMKISAKKQIIDLERIENNLEHEIKITFEEFDKMKRAAKYDPKYNINHSNIQSQVKINAESCNKMEIQDFLDFNAKHKHNDGWDDYHHKLFLKCWHKHFNVLGEKEDIKTNVTLYSKFLYYVLDNIPNMTLEDVQRHAEWYQKYIILKKRQENVLNNWKKRNIKSKQK